MTDITDGLGIVGEAFSLLGGLLSFLGATGIVLFALSLILMALVGAFSPLPKMINYIAIVGLVTGLALFGIDGFGELPDRVIALRGYLILMLGPVVGVYLIKGIFGRLFRAPSEAEQLTDAITELTEQVAQLRRDNKGERVRETLTLEAETREPRRLVRRLSRH